MQEPIGLALGSGSARGLAHIGVLKVFEQNNISVSHIAGSSIGALFGAHYAAYKSAAKLEKLIYDLSEKRLINFLDLTVRGGFVKGIKIETFLEETFKDVTFKNLQIPFAAVATDLYNGSKIVMKSGSLITAIRASISIPALLQPVQYNNMMLADGGLSDPIPVDVVKSMGARKIVAVNLDTYVLKQPKKIFIPISKLPINSINILRHNLALTSLTGTPYVISPLVTSEFFAWHDFFKPVKVKEYIAEGERATRALLPNLLSQTSQRKNVSLLERITSLFR